MAIFRIVKSQQFQYSKFTKRFYKSIFFCHLQINYTCLYFSFINFYDIQLFYLRQLYLLFVAWKSFENVRDHPQYKNEQHSEKQKPSCVKIGMWIEFNNGYHFYSRVTYHGRYKNGKIVVRWYNQALEQQVKNKIFHMMKLLEVQLRLEDGQNTVISLIYIHKTFKIVNINIVKSTYMGYFFKEEERKTYQLIGGGLYDGSIKAGQWIELDDEFEINQQFTYKGEYQNGNKVGTWVKMDIREEKL